MNKKVYDFTRVLGTGRDEAVKGEMLAALVGVDTTSHLRQMINESRRSGQLIMSCQSGYYLPENSAEIENFIKSMTHRTIMMYAAIRAAKAELKKRKIQESGQMSFGDYAFDDFEDEDEL